MTKLTTEQHLNMYRLMATIRRFEDHLFQLFLQGLVPGTLHQYQGQEAVAVGVCSALGPDDIIFSTHRPVGHGIAKGMNLDSIAAEIWGKSAGFAAVKNAPVVFMCENNQYAASTHLSTATKITDIADRAAGYGIPGVIVDGMDVLKVYDVTLAAVERARRGEGPTLIEAKTYRFKGHSRGDPGKYRSSDELCGWQARDPVPRFRQYILDEGIADATLTKIEDRVDKAIREAVEFAIAAADPESSDTYTHVYADNRE